MTLFLVLSVVLLFLLVAFLPWEAAQYVRKLHLFSVFFKGLLCFIPAYLVCLIVSSVVGSPIHGFSLYLSLLVKENLAPLLLGLGLFVLVQRRLEFPTSQDGIFLTVFSFLSGYYSLFGVTDWISGFGQWDPGMLFIVPLIRMATILAVSLGSLYFYRWEGRSAAGFFGSAAGLCLVAAAFHWLYGVSFPWLAAILALIAFLAAAALFIIKFPRVLRVEAGVGA